MQRDIQESVRRTFAYAAVFKAGLTFSELHKWLLVDFPVSPSQLREALQHEPLKDHIQMQQRQTFLGAWKQAVAFTHVVRWIPWVQSVWVTGSLAAHHNTEQDDVDFLIITDHKRLWLSRLLIVVLGRVLGRVRTYTMSGEESASHWCLNLWLEPSALVFPYTHRTLFVARELSQATPIYRRSGVRTAALLWQNTWAKRWTENGWQHARRRAACVLQSAPLPLGFLWFSSGLSWFWDICNEWARQWQWRLISRHRTREIVEDDRAFFHPRDTQRQVQQRYEKICALLKVEPWPSIAHKH